MEPTENNQPTETAATQPAAQPAPGVPAASPSPAPDSTTPAAVAPQPARKHKGLIIGLIVGGVLLLAIIAVMVFAVVAVSGTHKYTNLKQTTAGSVSGEKVSFSYPSLMKPLSSTDETSVYADAKPGSKTPVSEMEVVSTSLGGLTPESIANFKDIMKNKKEGYQDAINAFMSETSRDMDNLTFGSFTDFSSAGVQNGLQASFSYTNKTSHLPGKGRIIYGFGKKKLYILVILAENKTWEANTDAWDKIANSFAVDQP